MLREKQILEVKEKSIIISKSCLMHPLTVLDEMLKIICDNKKEKAIIFYRLSEELFNEQNNHHFVIEKSIIDKLKKDIEFS